MHNDDDDDLLLWSQSKHSPISTVIINTDVTLHSPYTGNDNKH